MKNKKIVAIFAIAILLAAVSPIHAAEKVNRSKIIITEIDGTTITATKSSKTYVINAERARLKNAKNKTATIDQIFIGDQIDVSGTRGADGIIIAKTIKDRSLKGTDLTRRNVGPDNLQAGVISDLNFILNGVITEDKIQSGTITNASISDSASISASKLNLANAIIGADIQNGTITSDKLADGITLTTGNISTLDLGTNTITDGNFTGNWNFNAGNLSGIGTIGSGDITTSGTVTASGTGNNYFEGGVGIGTTNPLATLTVNGNITLESNSAAISIGTGGQVISGSDLGVLRLRVPGYTSGGDTNSVVFRLGGNKQKMYFADSGSQGFLESGSALRLVAGVQEFFTITPTNYVDFTTTGGINTTGNVGIGTTNPLVKLEVDGIIKTKERSTATCDANSEGGIYYDSDDSHFYGCDGATWHQLDN